MRRVFAFLLVCACAPSTGDTPAVPDAGSPPKTRKVLVIGIDGLRPDAVTAAHAPKLDALRAAGAWTMKARTQTDTNPVSAPGWMSVLTGARPMKHGVLQNGDEEHRVDGYPTFLWRARNTLGLRTYAAFSWIELTAIIEPDATDRLEFGSDATTASNAEAELRDGEDDVHFVYFVDVDETGHRTGFDPVGSEYLGAMETTDGYVARLLAAIAARPTRAKEDWLVVVTTDHGGSGRNHTEMVPECQTVFVFIAGDGVVTGELLDEGVTHMDVHATVMVWFGDHSPMPDSTARGISVP